MFDGFVLARLLSDFLFAFTTIFALVNPPGIALIFHARTGNLSEPERAKLARSVAFYSYCILLGSLWFGAVVLGFFGISVPALRIGGGLVVALSGYQMLTRDGPEEAAQSAEALGRAAFFPLTLPLTIGPGSIAAAIAIGADTRGSWARVLQSAVSSAIVAFAMAATIYLFYKNSAALVRVLGPEGTAIATRLTAFLLFCLGIQIMLTGVLGAVQPLLDAIAVPPAP
ncbi:MarC family protein [Roseococcus sp. YIM B11640]|uniref:MarC family protein n=1 Tax=Roseococcus sp. YIM B11640 TaxID=3133973 RepID=UPI003C7EB241